MASINTNFTAGLALRGLSYSQSQIAKAQDRISTGFRVQEAKDDAAYWSIATTMGSDSKAMSAVQDALALGSATAGVAYAAINTTLKLVNQMKERLITGREPGVDLGKIQADITGLQAQMLSTAASATFSGENWLTIDSSTGADVKKSIVSSYGRSDATNVSIGTIELKIYDATTGDTIALVDKNPSAAASKGLLDRMQTSASGSQWQVAGVNISLLDHSPGGVAELDSIITGVDDTIA
jgi:flagellin